VEYNASGKLEEESSLALLPPWHLSTLGVDYKTWQNQETD
jgi:hypothetical protein